MSSIEYRNDQLPLSENLYIGQGSLERQLLGVRFDSGVVDVQSLPIFSDLPDKYTSLSTEKFLDAIVPPDKKIPRGFDIEYGGWVHSQKLPKRLLYPVEASVGRVTHDEESQTTNATVDAEFVQTENIHPLVHAHSHPSNFPFSGTDLFYMVRDDLDFPPTAMAMTTTDKFNMLMLRTQETQLASHQYFNEVYLESFKKGWEEGQEYTKRLRAVESGIHYMVAFDVLQDNYDGDPHQYFAQLMAIQSLSEIFKFGIYFSQKDGNYVNLDKENSLNYLEKIAEKTIKDFLEKDEDNMWEN